MSALLALLERLIPRLPSSFDAPLSELVGTLAYLGAPRARRAVRGNLARIVPERTDRERLVRRTFVAQVRHYLEIFRLVRLTPEEVRRDIGIIGWESFERAYARGKGIMIASAHLGPVSLCGQIFVARGITLTMPIERETSAFARSVNRGRTAMGLHFIHTTSAMGIHRVLKRGGVLGILGDRAVTGVGVRVPFFGAEALLPSAPVALALGTGAAFIPAFAHHDARGYVAELEEPIELERTGDHERDVRDGVRRFAAVLERHIRRAPEEWSVFEDLWRA